MDGDIRSKVREHYGSIARKVGAGSNASCCCSSSCCGDDRGDSRLYDMEYLKELPEEAVKASLGCANPIAFADLKEGERVLDLGSGGGIDAFIASKYVGNKGRVYGLDMTDEMLLLAHRNKVKMGIANVEFIRGCIEDIPMQDECVDVILSNCVINLCESKERALSEAYRVLKPGGRLAIADIVMLKGVPEDIRKSAELWVGCIAGALPVQEYRDILEKTGFKNIEIEPVNIYTADFIEGIAGNNAHLPVDKAAVSILDGAFAGAAVKAVKQEA